MGISTFVAVVTSGLLCGVCVMWMLDRRDMKRNLERSEFEPFVINKRKKKEELVKCVRNFCYIHKLSRNDANNAVIEISAVDPKKIKGYGLKNGEFYFVRKHEWVRKIADSVNSVTKIK